jgi:hypothetical protein
MIEADRKPLPVVPPPPPEPEAPLFKLDLACGQRKQEGFVGVDRVAIEGVDRVFDLLEFPWPIEDASVDEIHCSHYFEHVPAKLRFRFMDEVWRVLKPGCRALFICPYYSSMRAIQDPTHEWPPICEASFAYFDARWRKDNGLSHYDVKCDFECTFGYAHTPEWAVRSEDAKAWAVRHYINVVADLHTNMVRR